MKEAAGSVTDEVLVEMVLKGNKSAFETLMIRHRSPVTRIIAGRVPADRVEELLQDTFIRAYKSLSGFSGKKPLAHWLSVIAVRACLDFWRKAYRNKEVPISQLGEDAVNWLSSVPAEGRGEPDSAGSSEAEAAEVLEWAMNRLSANERMVLSLTHLEGYSTGEAAELLGWSRSNVKVKAFRARNKLRALINTLLKLPLTGEGS